MDFAVLLAVVLGSLAVHSFADRRGLQPEILILLVACSISFVPGMPHVQLAPETIMGIVTPPLLYSAALHFSPIGFARNLRSILSLGVGLVTVTTLLAGLVTHWLMPAIGLTTALALGAAVSPPDTASTVAHGREFGVPRRTIDILIGESLINDAAALTLVGVAVSAVTGEREAFDNPALAFLYSSVTGTVVGVLVGLLAAWARRRATSATVGTALNLIVPFVAYLLAEHLAASDVFSVVAAGFTVSLLLARRDGFGRLHAVRLQERQTWPVVDTLLESFVFAYMGLQCRSVLVETHDASYSRGAIIGVGMVLILVVVLTRFCYIFLLYGHQIGLTRIIGRRRTRDGASTDAAHVDGETAERGAPLTWKSALISSWAGMRGILTLAAVAGLPLTTLSGEPFPGRSAIQQIAFVVVIGTVVVLGVPLPWLADALRFDARAENQQEALMLAHSSAAIQKALDEAGADATGPAQFDIARETVLDELRARRLDDLTTIDEIHRIDLEQAAAEARTSG